MLELEKLSKIYVYNEATDMRGSFDRLASLVNNNLELSVEAGVLFVFFNKARDRVKFLYWDDDGYALWYKRLETGKFKVPIQEGYESFLAEELRLLLSGMELSRIKFRRR